MDDPVSLAMPLLLAGIKAKAEEEEQQESKRTKWMKKWLQRKNKGSYCQIFNELTLEEQKDFYNYCRLTPEVFFMLLDKVTPLIEKQDTMMRESIPAGARLEVTLRWLGHGGTYTSLQYGSRISKQSLSLIIPETCRAIYQVLKDDYLQTPKTKSEWNAVAEDFNTRWQFPNCLGSLDGKHILIRPPPNSGSYYYNYKGTHSVILLALVNANYEFIYADVGVNGRASDSSAWEISNLRQAIESGFLNVPGPKPLPNSDKILPYVIVGDDAFPLKSNLMKPFPFRNQTKEERIFSYRLSRARRTVENAFGILSNKFRVLLNPINLEPGKVQDVVLACIALHNFLRKIGSNSNIVSIPTEEQIDKNIPDQGFLNLQRLPRNSSEEAKDIRLQFCEYFNNEGSVPWQNNFA